MSKLLYRLIYRITRRLPAGIFDPLFLRDGYRFYGIAWISGVLVRVAPPDAIDHVHTADNLPKNVEAAIQRGLWAKCNKELAAVGIGPGVGHSDHASFIKY